LSGSHALYCATSAKHDDCLIANDNPTYGFWSYFSYWFAMIWSN